MKGNNQTCDDGRNPVGVAVWVWGDVTHVSQGSANPGLKYGTPLAWECTKPNGLVELSPGLEQPWVIGDAPTNHFSPGNPNGVASIAD